MVHHIKGHKFFFENRVSSGFIPCCDKSQEKCKLRCWYTPSFTSTNFYEPDGCTILQEAHFYA